MFENLILDTDSYKVGHWNQYPADTTGVYSYFEARKGARFPYTVFFGLQYQLQKFMTGKVVNYEMLQEADKLTKAHFGTDTIFNYDGWKYIINEHGGKLPLRIKAVPEGTVVPINNVLMTVENTDPKCFWLTNAMETMLTHVWYPTTVATLSHYTVHNVIGKWLTETAHDLSALPFMLHDFGYRGASSQESAAIGGAAHLINSMGTDTIPAMLLLMQYYAADLSTLGFSVPATEHSVMTALGRDGEGEVVDRLFDEYPSGILSVVADSYNIYNFVKSMGSKWKSRIMERDGVFVVRPDSTTPDHPTPEKLVVWIAEQLWHDFGGTNNAKSYRILDPHVRILWGDGIDPDGIDRILAELALHSFSAENMVFGMGGGLLQKVNRDTQRFAFKASAIQQDGVWHDVYKQPLDHTKDSKKGRLKLCHSFYPSDGHYAEYYTLGENAEWVHRGVLPDSDLDVLETVFENGELVKEYSFDEIRKNAGATFA